MPLLILFFFHTYPLSWSGLMGHFQTADRPLSPWPGLSEEEFFLGLGPWPNIYIGLGFPVYHPHSGIFASILVFLW